MTRRRRPDGGLDRAAVALAAALALSACGTLGGHPRLQPAPVAKPPPPPVAPPAPAPSPPRVVPEPPPPRAGCVPRTLQKAPRYPDSDQALREAGGAADRYQLMAAGRLLRIQRLAELERVLEACRQAGSP